MDIITYNFFKSCDEEEFIAYYCEVQKFFKDDSFFYTNLDMKSYFHFDKTIAYRHIDRFCWPYATSTKLPIDPKKEEFMIFDGTPKQLRDCVLQLLNKRLAFYTSLKDKTEYEMAKPDFVKYFDAIDNG